jgi:FkbM family methyltransferase
MARIRNRIVQLLVRFFFVLRPNVANLIRYLAPEIDSDEYRHVRARMIRAESDSMRRTLQALSFSQAVVSKNDEPPRVRQGRVFLSTSATNKYFKSAQKKSEGDDKSRWQFLLDHGIKFERVIDIGACFGETTLDLCARYPRCRILAIEPVPENFSLLKNNIEYQFFDTSRITALNIAVSDKAGRRSITAGAGQSNTIILDERNEMLRQSGHKKIEVNTNTLSAIAEENGFNSIDFIKINIEGAEPLLTNDFIKLAPAAVHLETSSQNTFEKNDQMMGR